MSVATYTKTGNKATTAAKLDKAVFGVEAKNQELLKQAYVSYLANGRDNLAVVKRRGEVRGGGRKPWRQKGTGRARFGSIRNPIWRGGGITFGPTGEENYSKKLNQAAKQQAIRQALSMAATENRLNIIEAIESKDGKTAEVAKMLKKLDAKKNVLIAVDHLDEKLVRACSNLQGVKLVQANYLNVFDLVNADTILITSKGLEVVHAWLGGKK